MRLAKTLQRKPIVAVDFDGTMSEFDIWRGPGEYGAPVEGAIIGVKLLLSLGCEVIIWTCRDGEGDGVSATGEAITIGEWLNDNGLPKLPVNVDLSGIPATRKIVADFYIDDRGTGWQGWHHAIEVVLLRLNEGGMLDFSTSERIEEPISCSPDVT